MVPVRLETGFDQVRLINSLCPLLDFSAVYKPHGE